MTDETVTNWMNGYLKAWESNEPDDVRALFADDAEYRYSPSDSAPLQGIEAIVADFGSRTATSEAPGPSTGILSSSPMRSRWCRG